VRILHTAGSCYDSALNEMNLLVMLLASMLLVLLLVLAWLVAKPLPTEVSLANESRIEDLLPSHARHLPQLRQAFASADSRFMRAKVSKEDKRLWEEERRQVLRGFLGALAEDFVRLNRLSRLVASISPHAPKRYRIERIWLSVCFRLTYWMVSIRVSLGRLRAMNQLVRLAELVGILSAHAETGMAQLETESSPAN
jgi:hypothetical protein